MRHERAHLVGEAMIVGIEQIRAEPIDDEARLGLRAGLRRHRLHRPAASGASTTVCGR